MYLDSPMRKYITIFRSWEVWHVCFSMTSLMINRFTSVWLRANTRPQLVNSCRWQNPFRNESVRPLASQVLTCHLMSGPPWTSYFVKYNTIKDDQRGRSSFNWMVNGRNYRILRTGCWPYIKYHCTQGVPEDLSVEDAFFRVIKIINLGIPCLAYGLAATLLIRHTETVTTPHGPVNIYFLYKENKGAMY
ncbi:unnamed protein product [Allacma fusca]|uniref:Uncharacterized protein n=1 Tax=Allacma fusca TaxID=39272 RepID=A0A8J2K3M8_9HEXA|nr:unnamed protein product [Allacma fusca]